MFVLCYPETLAEICLGVARREIKYFWDYLSQRRKLSRTVSTGGVSESSIVIGFGLVNVGQPGWLILIKTPIFCADHDRPSRLSSRGFWTLVSDTLKHKPKFILYCEYTS